MAFARKQDVDTLYILLIKQSLYNNDSTTEECPEAIFIMCFQSIYGVMIQAFMVRERGTECFFVDICRILSAYFKIG